MFCSESVYFFNINNITHHEQECNVFIDGCDTGEDARSYFKKSGYEKYVGADIYVFDLERVDPMSEVRVESHPEAETENSQTDDLQNKRPYVING